MRTIKSSDICVFVEKQVCPLMLGQRPHCGCQGCEKSSFLTLGSPLLQVRQGLIFRICDVCVGVVPESKIGQQRQEGLMEAATLILPHFLRYSCHVICVY